MACMLNVALSDCPNLLKLQATYRGVEILCILDSGATHSFVHPCVVQQMSAATSKGAKLTVAIANGSTSVSDDVLEVGLVLTAQGDSSHQVTVQAVLVMLGSLQTDVILDMDFLQWYNPQIIWIDSHVAMPYLAEIDGVCVLIKC